MYKHCQVVTEIYSYVERLDSRLSFFLAPCLSVPDLLSFGNYEHTFIKEKGAEGDAANLAPIKKGQGCSKEGVPPET